MTQISHPCDEFLWIITLLLTEISKIEKRLCKLPSINYFIMHTNDTIYAFKPCDFWLYLEKNQEQLQNRVLDLDLCLMYFVLNSISIEKKSNVLLNWYTNTKTTKLRRESRNLIETVLWCNRIIYYETINKNRHP